MTTRREFLFSAAAAMTAIPAVSKAHPVTLVPLEATPRLRKLYVERTPDWDHRLYSDGPKTPQPLIKRAVIERAFGEGTYDTLRQRDHWALIDAGWFSDEELFVPQPVRDPEYNVWQSYYRPLVEAHDLLEDVFFNGQAPWWGVFMREYSLTLAVHPNTPRLATAKIHDIRYLPDLASAVAARTPYLVVDYGDLLERPSWAEWP